MKKILISILGATLLFGGCGQKKQSNVDELTSQVLQLTDEKEKLETEKESFSKKAELLCAMIGEQSSAGYVSYVGGKTFKSNADGVIFEIPDMTEKCFEMVDAYGEVVEKRAQNLLKSETPEKVEKTEE